MHFDLVIRGGTVIDGTGAPAQTADVGIVDHRIQQVGDLTAATADEILAATDRVVCPGFIDIHSHSDTTLLAYPEAESRVCQGITTEVVGNCSFSPFPLTPEVRQFMKPTLEMGQAEIDWDWDDQRGYLDRLREQGTSVNVVPLVGHGSLRIAAMGRDNREPTHSELKQMQHLAAEAIDQGAFGLSTGLTLAPSSYGSTGEIVAIARAVAERGGFYATHSRLWAGNHWRATEEAIEVGRRAGLPVQVSHQAIIDPRYFHMADRLLGLMEDACRSGIDVTYDVYPYTAGSSKLDQYLPDWALEGGTDALLKRLDDPAARAAIRDETDRGWFRGIPWQWDRVQIAHVGQPDAANCVGLSIAQLAERRDLAPIDCMLELIRSQRNDVSVVQFNREETDVQALVAHRLGTIGTDGVAIAPRGAALGTRPHPRYYGTCPRILGRYVRELGVLSLPEAIRKMSGACAARLGLADRGTIASGRAADLVIFDPATVADRATFSQPHRFPLGIDYVLVGGQQVVTPQGHTRRRPGRVLAR